MLTLVVSKLNAYTVRGRPLYFNTTFLLPRISVCFSCLREMSREKDSRFYTRFINAISLLYDTFYMADRVRAYECTQMLTSEHRNAMKRAR